MTGVAAFATYGRWVLNGLVPGSNARYRLNETHNTNNCFMAAFGAGTGISGDTAELVCVALFFAGQIDRAYRNDWRLSHGTVDVSHGSLGVAYVWRSFYDDFKEAATGSYLHCNRGNAAGYVLACLVHISSEYLVVSFDDGKKIDTVRL